MQKKKITGTLVNKIQEHINSIIWCDQMRLISGMQGWFSYLPIKQCDSPHYQNTQKSYDSFNGCGKSIWQNLIAIYD